MNYYSNKINDLSGILLGIYLGFAPVYWFPGLTQSDLFFYKYLVLLSGIALTWSVSIRMQHIVFPKGMAGPIGITALVLSCWSGFFQSESDIIYNKIIDFIMGFLLMWTIFVFIRCKGSIQKVFLISACIISCLTFVTITNFFFGYPDWRSPLVFNSKPLCVAGFGAERTGWSNALVFYPAAVFALFGAFPKSRHIFYWLCSIMILLILGSQLISGGRAGLLTTLIVVTYLIFMRFQKKYLLMFLSIVFMVIVSSSDFLTHHLRINRLKSSENTYYELDNFSAGRISLYKNAYSLIKKRFVLGYGFERIEFTDIGVKDVHNLWLKMALESGVAYPVTFIIFVCSVLNNSKKKKLTSKLNKRYLPHTHVLNRHRHNYTVFTTMIFSGLFLALFEPNVLVGSFQPSAYWWVACGAVLATNTNLVIKKIGQPKVIMNVEGYIKVNSKV